jgi:hypothetical protein
VGSAPDLGRDVRVGLLDDLGDLVELLVDRLQQFREVADLRGQLVELLIRRGRAPVEINGRPTG